MSYLCAALLKRIRGTSVRTRQDSCVALPAPWPVTTKAACQYATRGPTIERGEGRVGAGPRPAEEAQSQVLPVYRCAGTDLGERRLIPLPAGAYDWDLNMNSPRLSLGFKLKEERISAAPSMSPSLGPRRSEIVAFYESDTPPVPQFVPPLPQRKSMAFATSTAVASTSASGKTSPTTPSRRQPYHYDGLVPLPDTLVFPPPAKTPTSTQSRSPRISPRQSLEQSEHSSKPSIDSTTALILPEPRTLRADRQRKEPPRSLTPQPRPLIQQPQARPVTPQPTSALDSSRSSILPLYTVTAEKHSRSSSSLSAPPAERRQSCFRRPLIRHVLIGSLCLVVGVVAGLGIGLVIRNGQQRADS
jgi:hypothetical protein